MAATPALVIEDLPKRFGALEVLKRVSMTVRELDVISVIGSSGSRNFAPSRLVALAEHRRSLHRRAPAT